MSPLAILFICFQACLIQNMVSACSCGLGAGSFNNAAAAFNAASNAAAANAAAANIAAANSAAAWNSANAINAAAAISNAACGYSAYGCGDVAVVGELPVCGSTSVAGSVPVSGGLTFSGLVPASGLVTISGSCACPKSYAAGAELAELAILNAAIANAELSADLASINSWNSLAAANAASQQWNGIGSGCNCNKIYY